MEETCRICRGEATEAQPLLHPCRCRGLIKYTHQDCLLEWLRHLRKLTQECDICHTPYKFRVVYDPAMPLRMPFSAVVARLAALVRLRAVQALLLLLFAFCAIEVPLYWKFVGRVFCIAIDGRFYLLNGASLRLAFLYGFEQLDLLSTYAGGLFWVLGFLGVATLVALEHEWIVRDEGFTRMLLKKIGKEPKSRLSDLVKQLLQQYQATPQNGARELRLNQALQDLRNEPGFQQHEETLRRALNAGDLGALTRHEGALPVGAVEERHVLDNGYLRDNDSESEAEEELQRQRNIEDAAMAEAANNGEILALFGMHLDLGTPVIVFVFANVLVLIVLFAAYFLPLVVGSFVALLLVWSGWLWARLVSWRVRLPIRVPRVAEVAWRDLVAAPASDFVDFIMRSPRPLKLGERIVVLAAGYIVALYGVHRYMEFLVLGRKPVMGPRRSMYTVLFEIAATAKVFSVFALEVAALPLYCGWLLDWCLTPLFVLSIYNRATGEYTMLATLAAEITRNTVVRLALYWAAGTSYMYLFAMFVGMARLLFLRPGVLYFIRSEDPNARLIHDALVKPFSKQIRRMFLTIKAYTAFIVLGIGSVTWLVRYVVDPDIGAPPNVFLPIRVDSPKFLPPLFTLACYAIRLGRIVLLLLAQLVQAMNIYWGWVFALCCHRLRLSHYILGRPVAQERGTVVYRSVWHQFICAVPDYSRPLSYPAAMELFESDSSVAACFVPDGCYMRVPGVDNVSKRFIRELFVKVTKNDVPLGEPEAIELDSDSDSEFPADDTYAVVYCPPLWWARSMALVALICLFGIVAVLAVAVVAVMVGRPMVTAVCAVYDFWWPGAQRDWRLVDLSSLFVGLDVLVAMLGRFGHLVGIERPEPAPEPAPEPLFQRAVRLQAPQQMILGVLLGLYYALIQGVFTLPFEKAAQGWALYNRAPWLFSVALQGSAMFLMVLTFAKKGPRLHWMALMTVTDIMVTLVAWWLLASIRARVFMYFWFCSERLAWSVAELWLKLLEDIRNERFKRGTTIEDVD